MGIGAFAAQVAADLSQALQVDPGHLVAFPYLLQLGELVGELLEDLVGYFPVQGQDDRLEAGERGVLFPGELEQVDIVGIKRFVREKGEILGLVESGRDLFPGSVHVLAVLRFHSFFPYKSFFWMDTTVDEIIFFNVSGTLYPVRALASK